MKSFRFSYILAMLLAGGATTALTGCIDTTEPAGITELRGAKALLLKARAAFIDAKTQRENVYMEQDKVQLEQDKIDLEISKLNLELQKAVNDLKMDSTNAAKQLVLEEIQKKRDKLALEAEQDWWTLQQSIVSAEQTYKKAVIDLQVALLTYKDDKIAEKIEEYSKELYGENWKNPELSTTTTTTTIDKDGNPQGSTITTTETAVFTGGLYGLLNQANSDLVQAQRELVLFTTSNENYLASLTLKQTEQQKILDIQNELLTNLKALAEKYSDGNNLQSVKERLIELDQEIDALRQEKIDLYNEAQTLKTTTLAGVSQKLANYNETLSEDSTIVIGVVDEKLQNDLGNNLFDTYEDDEDTKSVFEDAFKKNNEGKYEMVSPIEITASLRTLSSSNSLTTVFLPAIQSIYQNQYVEAYKNYTGKTVTANVLFEPDGKTVKAAYNTQIQNEKERLALDQAKVRAEYETAMKTWLDAYKAFTDDLNAYKGYKEKPTVYEDAEKLISDYKEDIRDLKAGADYDANYLALAKAVRDNLVKNYFTLREPIDGVSSAYATFKENYIGVDENEDDKLTTTNMRSFTSALTSSILGAESIEGKTYSSSDLESEDVKGTLPDFLRAAEDLFGHDFGSYGSTTPMSLKQTLQPQEGDNGTYVAPEGLNAAEYDDASNKYSVQSGSKFMKAALTYNEPAILSTLSAWVALYDEIEAEDKKVDELVSGLLAAKTALINANKEALSAVWEKEMECYLVDAKVGLDMNKDGDTDDADDIKNIFADSDNPYYEYYIKNVGQTDADNTDFTFVAPAATSELAALEAEHTLLTNWSNNEKFTYVKYNETSGQYESGTTDTWENLIEAQEDAVETAQKGLDNIAKRIELLNKIGWYDQSANATDALGLVADAVNNPQYKELLEENIRQAQSKVDLLQAEFDRVQAKIQALIDAAADENFGSSDATYPGFEVDNSTSTNTPSTDTPSTDTPSGDATDQEQPATEEPAE